MTPEEKARQEIDRQLAACGWIVQDHKTMNIMAGPGVAVREFPLKTGFADYLPPIEEQKQIAVQVDERLSVTEKVSDEAEQQHRRAFHLRQAILKRAFEGKLVPQDPNDEPASVLLERIRAARAVQAGSLRGASRRPKRRASGEITPDG